MEWLEVLEILERALEAATNLPTAAERTRAIAAAYEAAAANLGNMTAREVLQQIYNGRGTAGRVGELARLILRRVPEQAARAALTSGAGAGAGGRALTFLGLTWGAWALLLGGGLLVIGGSYIYFRPDRPVLPGPAMSRPKPIQPNVAPFTPTAKSQRDKYYIYAINTSGWSFYVGRTADVEGRPANSFADGGTGNQPVEYKKLVSKDFDSSAEAVEYLKARVSPGHQSVWTGTWLKFEGSEYRTVHVGL